jgi:hypothetical protein
MYAPGITYHGDQYLAQGITGAAGAVAGAITNVNQTKEKVDYLNSKAAGLAQLRGADGQPLMTAEDLNKYYSGSVGAKQGMLADTLFRYEQGMQNQQRDQAQQNEQARIGIAQQNADTNAQQAQPFQPTAEDLAAYDKAGYAFLRQSAHGGTAAPLPDAGGHGGPQFATAPNGETVAVLGGKMMQVKNPAQRPLPESAITDIKAEMNQMDTAVKSRNEAQTELDKKNKFSGWDWVHMGTDYQKQLDEANKTIAAAQAKIDQIKQLYISKATQPSPLVANAAAVPEMQSAQTQAKQAPSTATRDYKARAAQAINDPEATPAEKAMAKRILGMP